MNQNDSGQTPQSQNQQVESVQISGTGHNYANAQAANNVEINQNTAIQILADKIKTDELIVASPYKGLKAFEPEDAAHFFGRDQFLVELNKELEQTNLLLLLGASGSGKSSVIRAGLIPLLQREYGRRLVSLILTPDRDPFESFYASLLSSGCKQSQAQLVRAGQVDALNQAVKILKEKEPESFLLVFVDQFEELFTISEPEKRDRFIQGLCSLSRQKILDVKIVATMRSDFLNYLDPFPVNLLAKLTQKHRPLITAMELDELRSAIERPAANHGVVFEAGLVEEIIKDLQRQDLQRQAGYLPLLQYTLDLLWKLAVRDGSIQGRTLSTRAYRELGGVREALRQRADKIYADLPEVKQLAAQRIFLKLVEIDGSEAGETEWKPVRHRASRAEFKDKVEQEVLAMLIDQKLLVSDASIQATNQRQPKVQDSTVEIAHEILLTSWTTLNSWIQENRRWIALRNRLNDDVALWRAKKADSDLLSGSKLTQVVELHRDPVFERVLGGFSREANQFIDASVKLRERQRQRIYLSLGGVGSVLLLTAGFWGWLNYTNTGLLTQIRWQLINVSQRTSSDHQSQAAFALAEDGISAQALKLANQIQNSDDKAYALIAIAKAYIKLNQPQQAADLLKQAIASARQIGDFYFKAHALIAIAEAYIELNQPQAAANVLKDAMGVDRQIQTITKAIDELSQQPTGADVLKDARVADVLKDARIAIAQHGTSTAEIVNDLTIIAEAYIKLDQQPTAADVLKDARIIADRTLIEFGNSRPYLLTIIAEAYIKLDQQPTAADVLKDARVAASQLRNDDSTRSRDLINIAEAYIKLDQQPTAADVLEDAIAAAKYFEHSSAQMIAIAEAYIKLDQQPTAADVLKAAIAAVSQSQGYFNNEAEAKAKAEALIAIAEASGKFDQQPTAADVLKAARVAAGQLWNSSYEVKTLVAIAEAYIKLDQQSTAADVLKAAIAAVRQPQGSDQGFNDQDEAKAEALIAIAEASGKFDQQPTAADVLKAARVAASKLNSSYEVKALIAIAEAYIKLDQQSTAANVLKDARVAASQLSSSYEVDALIAIAKAEAEIENWGQALQVVRQCPSDDCQIKSLARVLIVHAEQQHPEWKEEENEEE